MCTLLEHFDFHSLHCVVFKFARYHRTLSECLGYNVLADLIMFFAAAEEGTKLQTHSLTFQGNSHVRATWISAVHNRHYGGTQTRVEGT